MKCSYKLRAIGDVAAVVAAAPSVSEAARRLGVDRSTVKRWIAAEKIPRPVGRKPSRRRGVAQGAARAGQSPEAWARAVRRKYDLSDTEQQLVTLARDALALAREPERRAETRLAAMGRYEQLVRDLNLEDDHGKAETTAAVYTWPRRVN